MANTQALRRRIRSVRSTQQITRAMKMVAAARFRRAQERVLETRPYGNALEAVLRSVASRVSPERYPLLEEREERHVTLVVVTSDKGLCGAFNANVLREAINLLGGGRWEHVDLVLIGRKAIEFFRHRGIAAFAVYPDLMSRVTPETAEGLAHTLAERFATREVDAVYWLANRFRSIIQQKAVLTRLFPLERSALAGGTTAMDYLYEPSPRVLLDHLLRCFAEFQVLTTLLSSLAAEHASRMTAMEAATKNAGELIDSLNLTYNRVRQASITKELIEIVSGAQALGGS